MVALNLLISSLALASSVVAVPTAPPKACKNPVKRYEWRQLPLPQRKAYIDAVLCLNKKPAISGIPGTVDRFSDFQAVHKNQTLQIHWVGHFLLWHRYFLATYEKALRDECGYTGGQPYWDWSLDANPNNLSSTAIFETDIFSPTTGFGGNGNKIEPLPSENPSNLTGGTGGGCVQTGPFVAEAFTVNYPAPSCLKRDFVPWIINKFADAKNVQKVLDQPDYTSMAWEVEGKASFDWPNVHASGHFGVGGVLGQAGNAANSPGEPIFYLHHGNVDYIYWLWQQRDLEKRLSQVGGPVARKDYGGENVTLEFEVGLAALAPVVKLRDLMDTEGGTLCYTY